MSTTSHHAKQALEAYHDAKGKLRPWSGGSRADYGAARAAMAHAFEAALTAVFEEAKPVHGLVGARYVRYRQILHGVHLVDFADEGEIYEVAFRPDLALECIIRVSDMSRVWPPRGVSA